MIDPSPPGPAHPAILDTPQPELRVVIPARNEERRIETTVVDCCRYFGSRARVIVVANDCSDNTAGVVRRLMASFSNLELVETARAIGKGGAVRVGFARGNEPFVGFVDADGSAKAEALDHLMSRLHSSGASAAIGSRWLASSVILAQQTISRRIASRGFNVLVRALFRLPYNDTQCGAKVVRREAIGRVLDGLELSNFAFDVDLIVSLRERGFRVIEEPIAWGDSAGTSIDLVPAAFSMALSILRLRVKRSPLRRLPFVDLLARTSVIPVSPVSSLLVLRSRAGNAYDAVLAATLAELAHEGHHTVERDLSTLPKRLAFWAWYLCGGHASVDAIAYEDRSSFLARFTTKAKARLTGDYDTDAANLKQLLQRLRYRSVFRRADEIGEPLAHDREPGRA